MRVLRFVYMLKMSCISLYVNIMLIKFHEKNVNSMFHTSKKKKVRGDANLTSAWPVEAETEA